MIKFVHGPQCLKADDISFSNGIIFHDEERYLNFCMDCNFDIKSVFGPSVCTENSDDYLTIYASYDIATDTVVDDLILVLVHDDRDEELRYRMTIPECKMVREKMEEVCVLPPPECVAKTIKTVIATEQDGLDTRIASFVFEVPSPDFDIVAAAKAAAKEFCQTEEGQLRYEWNFGCFNWGDLDTYVPDEIMKKHGFCRANRKVAEPVAVMFDEQLVDEDDVCPSNGEV